MLYALLDPDTLIYLCEAGELEMNYSFHGFRVGAEKILLSSSDFSRGHTHEDTLLKRAISRTFQ